MEIVRETDIFAAVPVAATIGSFDGVHCGHVAMIAQARELAAQRSLPLTVVTFEQHPRLLFAPAAAPFLLTPFDERMALLASAGVERCFLLAFDRERAALSAREFMRSVLRDKINVRMLAVGYNHRFGHPAEGEGFRDYCSYGAELGIDVVQMSCFSPDGKKVSSSAVRNALAAGDVCAAAAMLGRRYSVRGSVVHGAALGRRLGFPTANISLDEPLQMLPSDGVYECIIAFGGGKYSGVVNVGSKPTIGLRQRTVEVYILDFSGDIYGCSVCVEFVRRLRDEQRFDSLDELRNQIGQDVCRVRQKI